MIQVTNWKYADIGTVVAATDMGQGQMCLIDGTGLNRRATIITDTDDAAVLAGNYCLIMKIGTSNEEVDSSTAPARFGDRKVAILAGDLCMEVRQGAKVRLSADLLGASLDPARSGATPAIGQALGIAGGRLATIAAATSAGIASPVVARVNKVFGTDVVIELVY
jgi:hypothetical protein